MFDSNQRVVKRAVNWLRSSSFRAFSVSSMFLILMASYEEQKKVKKKETVYDMR